MQQQSRSSCVSRDNSLRVVVSQTTGFQPEGFQAEGLQVEGASKNNPEGLFFQARADIFQDEGFQAEGFQSGSRHGVNASLRIYY